MERKSFFLSPFMVSLSNQIERCWSIMFNFIKNKLQKIFTHITSQLHSLFGRARIDEATLKELEILLISSDVGVKTTRLIITELRNQIGTTITDGIDLKKELHKILLEIVTKNNVVND